MESENGGKCNSSKRLESTSDKFIEWGIKMRAILIGVIASILIITLSCNYEYGNYGKDKPEGKTTELVPGAEMPAPGN